nr:uncharacterized protein LOC120964650 [Aegilops tauschii subsp. strangulata]
MRLLDRSSGESRLLDAKAAAARRLERRRLLLEHRAIDLASRALAARVDIDATHARCLAVAHDISSTNGKIEDAQRKAEEWDRFYESNRMEMEEFRPSSPQPPSTTAATTSQPHKEPPGLVKFSVEAALQELQSSGLHSDDAGIGAAEAWKAYLMAKKAKLDESLAAARQFRALLRQQLQKAFASQRRPRRRRAAVAAGTATSAWSGWSQPFKILNGGVSALMAESMASIGGYRFRSSMNW